MSASESDSDIAQATQSRCIWCNQFCKKLVVGKKYCSTCEGRMFRECSSCHRPHPSPNLFKFDEQRCNSCYKKLEKARLRRQEKKMEALSKANDVVKSTVKTTDIHARQNLKLKMVRDKSFLGWKSKQVYAIVPIVAVLSDDENDNNDEPKKD